MITVEINPGSEFRPRAIFAILLCLISPVPFITFRPLNPEVYVQ